MTHAYSITEESRSETDARVSLVLALRDGWAAADAQIATLWPDCRRAGAELVVVTTLAASQVAAARARYSGVNFVAAAADTGLDTLRALGMDAAGGDIVALVDPRNPHWERLTRRLLGTARAGALS